jgi:translocation and assembly module TamB
LRWTVVAVATAVTLCLVVFGLLQTRPGKDFLAAQISRLASNARFTWEINGLGGTVPFDMTAQRLTVTDNEGTWLTLRDVGLNIDPAGLLSKKLHIRLLRVGAWDQARPPSGPSPSLAELLQTPHLPFNLAVDRLVIERLLLAPPVLGTSVIATLAGGVAFEKGAAHAELDIHRIDGLPGNIRLVLTLAGETPKLSLQLHASDPTGIVADRIFVRTDHLPLALSIDGDGFVSNWHGRLTFAAGPKARADADLALAVSAETVLDLSARADVAALLPPALASIIGDRAKLALHANFGEQILLDRLSLATASGTLTGSGAFGGPGGGVAAHLRAELPDLAKLPTIAGMGLSGSAVLTAEISGTKQRPVLTADLAASDVEVSGARTKTVAAHIALTPSGALDNPQTRLAADGRGSLNQLAFSKGGAFAARLGHQIEWSLTGNVDRARRALDLTRLELKSGGVDLTAAGHLVAVGRGPVGSVKITGSATGLETGVAAADALLGPAPSLAGTIRRDEAGTVSADDFTLTSAAGRLGSDVRFDPASNHLTAALAFDIPRLEKLNAAVGANIVGSVSGKAVAEGPLDRLQLHTQLEGRGIAADGATIDQLRLAGVAADLSQPKATIDGSFRAGRLDGHLGLAAVPIGNTGLAINNLRLTAADSTIAGDLRIAFANGLVEGSLTGQFPDLSRWSALAGKPVGGSLDLTADLAATGGGQRADLTINGSRLTVGAVASRSAIDRLAATARLADLWRAPTGSGRLTLIGVHSGPLDFTNAVAAFDSRGPGRFAFQANAAGHPLNIAMAGEGTLIPGGGDLRLSRLTGSLDKENFALDQPLDVSRRGGDLSLSRLALRFGLGRIAGSGSLRRQALSISVDASDLPLAAGARLTGHPNVQGNLSLAATLRGTLRAPQGHITVHANGLALAIAHQAQTPRLGVAAEGDWNGRTIDIRGQVTGLHGDRMALNGSVPLLLTPAPLGISLPPQGRLALNLQGGGEIGHLANLLPLGEDRVSGHFTVDASVGGTIAAPSAGGRLQLTSARYENFASGAVLDHLQAVLVGNGDRFRLASLSAGDGVGGSVTAQGSLVLGGATSPTAQLSAALVNFRIAARDEVQATASGQISVTGPATAPTVTAPLTINRGQINLPNSLPPNVVVLKVTEVNGRQPTSRLPAASAPAIPAKLDITLGLAGPVLVQGHGLDSQWGGRLRITGTTLTPQIAGTLVANRGSYTLLGKDFRLTRGTIAFDGSAKIDPALDIIAEANAADITAQVVITGYASAPVISLSSTPLLPQDEILARVLFGNGVRQMTAGQGLQLAQAAAALSGKDPGVLDRLRGGLGLDWLRLGQGPAGAASSILNPSVVTPTTQSAAALSAGKYIAPGVSVGVTQGVSPPTSKVTVEVDLGHHLTVDTEAGQNGGTGIGINYNFDY